MKKIFIFTFIIFLITSCGDESEECVRFAELEFSECVADDLLNLCTQVGCGSDSGSFVLGLEGPDCSENDCSSFECDNVRLFLGEEVVIKDQVEFTDVQFVLGQQPESESVITGLVEVDGELQEFQCLHFD